MKNKLDAASSSEKLEKKLSENIREERRRSKSSNHRGSCAPKIVVCPPMEDQVSPASMVSSKDRPSRRLSRSVIEDHSLKSSSSSDSVTFETRSDDNSCSASDSGSDGSERHRRHRSSISLRRLFESLNSAIRSQSSSPIDRDRQSKKNPQPKRLLRPPVTYTYVKGLSGLPTQRVPRHIAYQYVT